MSVPILLAIECNSLFKGEKSKAYCTRFLVETVKILKPRKRALWFDWSPPETEQSSHFSEGSWQSWRNVRPGASGGWQQALFHREDNECKSVVALLRFSTAKVIKGPDQGCSVGDKSQNTRSESCSNPFSTVPTSRHLASSSASHVPPLRHKELRWCSIFSSPLEKCWVGGVLAVAACHADACGWAATYKIRRTEGL